jgi:hypothetical protein
MLGEKTLAKEHYLTCCKLTGEQVPKEKLPAALASAELDYKNGMKPKIKKIGMTYAKPPDVSYGVRPDMHGKVSTAIEIRKCAKYGPHFVACKHIKTGKICSVLHIF